ncbi:hypothetical protein ACET3X_007554 [Alternaria dauci]|uniref:Arrestin-like N-terminal domain-containing protein n=1 Tax=Alternaria dauci TaxID=48095 RepID=A0ABR3UCB7_9PLEO
MDALFEHASHHPLPPSLWWNESTICNEYFLRAEYVTENASFTLNPVVVHQLRFSPSVPEQGLPPITALVPAQPIRFERKSRPSTPEPCKERRAPLERLKTGLRGGSKEEEASSTSLIVLSSPSKYRVGASSKLKLSLQATLSEVNVRPAPVYLRGIRAQAIAHIDFRVPLASVPDGEIRKQGMEKFDLFNQRYSKPGIEITSDTVLEGFEINNIVPPTFRTYGVALHYDIRYDLLLECAGKESKHEIDVDNVAIEPMTRPGGHLGPPEEFPLTSGSDESFRSELTMGDVGSNGFGAEQPPPYYR